MDLFLSKSKGSIDFTLKFEKDSASMADANESPLPVKIVFFCLLEESGFCFLNFFKNFDCDLTSFSKASIVFTFFARCLPYIRKTVNPRGKETIKFPIN